MECLLLSSRHKYLIGEAGIFILYTIPGNANIDSEYRESVSVPANQQIASYQSGWERIDYSALFLQMRITMENRPRFPCISSTEGNIHIPARRTVLGRRPKRIYNYRNLLVH